MLQNEINGLVKCVELKVRVLSVVKTDAFLPGWVTMVTFAEHTS